MQQERKAAVSGIFYPKGCQEVEKLFQKFDAIFLEHLKDRSLLRLAPRAIIVPHAGYVYSGYSANIAYRLLANRKPKRVIVVGPSHKHYFEGMSGALYKSFETPCGAVPIDLAYLERMKKHFPLRFVPKAHQKEHSTEVQMPFIKYYLPHAKVIEIVYGKIAPKEVAKLLYALLEDPDNAIVISTDLSHFYTLKEAKERDNVCLNAIVKREPTLLERGCEACGKIGLYAILEVAKHAKLKTKLLDYRTSADFSGDTSRVVGYVSAAVGF